MSTQGVRRRLPPRHTDLMGYPVNRPYNEKGTALFGRE
jgi:hypothetical protein